MDKLGSMDAVPQNDEANRPPSIKVKSRKWKKVAFVAILIIIIGIVLLSYFFIVKKQHKPVSTVNQLSKYKTQVANTTDFSSEKTTLAKLIQALVDAKTLSFSSKGTN